MTFWTKSLVLSFSSIWVLGIRIPLSFYNSPEPSIEFKSFVKSESSVSKSWNLFKTSLVSIFLFILVQSCSFLFILVHLVVGRQERCNGSVCGRFVGQGQVGQDQCCQQQPWPSLEWILQVTEYIILELSALIGRSELQSGSE